jgi:peptidoglycan/LPS O-acetylase OafA/YrhL
MRSPSKTESAIASGAARHIPSLDGIRAVSFLLVFVAHAGLGNIVPGGMGVTIFFFLSGFLITTLMRFEHAKSGTLNLGHFWARRALRILPPFYLVLIGAALVSHSPVVPSAFAAQALHITNYWGIYRGIDGMPAGTSVYWSLAVEEHFYVLFPWLFLAMQRLTPRNQALVIYLLCAAVLAWRCVLIFGFHADVSRTYFATDTRVDSILFGCALAVWHSPVADRMALVESRWKYVYLPAALAVFVLCLVVRDDAFRETARYSLQGLALTVVFIAAIRFPHWAVMRALNTRPMNFLGLLSYSLYLLHFAVLIQVQDRLPRLNVAMQGILALSVSIACSWVIYIVIEKPCATLRRKLI